MTTVMVMVYASARKEAIQKTDEHEYTVFVREPAQRNMANTRVREIIAREYKVPASSVTILTGHHSPKKRFVIKN
jgi:uncharacterized protein YggU (UPF0235/DUF167 family)